MVWVVWDSSDLSFVNQTPRLCDKPSSNKLSLMSAGVGELAVDVE
jgi:hypothetical protein